MAASGGTKTARGHISLVQEQRLKLRTDDGRYLLLTLSHRAPVDPTDLFRWHEQDTPVRVEYSGEPGLASGVAHTVSAEEGALH